jgi:hypothetical protein
VHHLPHLHSGPHAQCSMFSARSAGAYARLNLLRESSDEDAER